MSRAIASARQRRAGISNPEPVQQVNQAANPAPPNGSGLTLPQVIALVDTRLIKLETFMKDTIAKGQTQTQMQDQTQNQTIDPSIIEEFNNRFIILADEIANMKDIVLKLQSFTMDVNRSLLENQINRSDKSLYVMHRSDVGVSEGEGEGDLLHVSDVDENEESLLMENIYFEKKEE